MIEESRVKLLLIERYQTIEYYTGRLLNIKNVSSQWTPKKIAVMQLKAHVSAPFLTSIVPCACHQREIHDCFIIYH